MYSENYFVFHLYYYISCIFHFLVSYVSHIIVFTNFQYTDGRYSIYLPIFNTQTDATNYLIWGTRSTKLSSPGYTLFRRTDRRASLKNITLMPRFAANATLIGTNLHKCSASLESLLRRKPLTPFVNLRPPYSLEQPLR